MVELAGVWTLEQFRFMTVSSVVSSVNMLRYELPGSAKYTKSIVDKLQSLASGIYTEKGDLKTEIKVIMGMLRTLHCNARGVVKNNLNTITK